MNEDILLDQQRLFEQYLQAGLKIRAICDDLGYSMEDSQMLLYIHVRGADFFLNGDKERAKQTYNLLKPETQEKIKKLELENNEITQAAEKIIVGNDIKNIEDKSPVPDFFTTQLENMYRLHIDREYLDDLLITYYGKVLPLMDQYDNKKIEEAFARGRARDDSGKI